MIAQNIEKRGVGVRGNAGLAPIYAKIECLHRPLACRTDDDSKFAGWEIVSRPL